MSGDQRLRIRLVTLCALTYLLVWAGGAVVGFVAALTSGIETDMRGLGHWFAGLAIAVLVFSLLWAVGVFAVLLRRRRPVRAGIAAIGTPAVVIGSVFVSEPLCVALGLVLPAAATWWATAPRE